MEYSPDIPASTPPPQDALLNQLKAIAGNMATWMKFLGIMYILQGAFAAISILGILIAWLPLWLGILLFQAGNRASNAVLGNNPRELIAMLDKLRLYFIINGIIFIIMLAFMVVSMVFLGSGFFSLFQTIQDIHF
ncbi:MAG: DUF5362 domain-containing protein [Calditrichaeota bacterium]|nr:DUF5362 domain-containing protein [Calditrichota bacterium]